MMDKKALQLSLFKVHMVYGFSLEPTDHRVDEESRFFTWFNSKAKALTEKVGHTQRSGWTTMYRLNNSSSPTIQFRLTPGLQTKFSVTHPPIWDSFRSAAPALNLDVGIERLVTISRDGVGSMTVTFTAGRRETAYTIREVLAAMLLAPRTSAGLTNGDDKSKPVSFELSMLTPGIVCPNADAYPGHRAARELFERNWDVRNENHLSCAYKAFLEGMSLLLEETREVVAWKEFDQGRVFCPNIAGIRGADTDGELVGDPQIPYMYVVGSMPYEQYQEAFLDDGLDTARKRVNRAVYTKELGAIIGRWLTVENVAFVSIDYWEKRGMLDQGSFLSEYMNSIGFTIYGGMATLTLSPCCPEATNPLNVALPDFLAIEAALKPLLNSVLKCIEFSRMRWHKVLLISHALDRLILDATSKRNVSDMLPLMETLISLREQVATHFEDPFSHMWEPTVGSHIAEYLHANMIEPLEDSVSKKLAVVSGLLDGRTAVFRAKDFVVRMNRDIEDVGSRGLK